VNKTKRVTVAASLALCSALLAFHAIAKEPKAPKILEFDTMIGLPAGMTGALSPIRGINGGGLPWRIGGASGELKADGRLELAVSGLVFDGGPNVGKNTVTSFRAVVSCVDATGAFVNVSTDPFPATVGLASEGGGNAEIETRLTLPEPCIAPIVFVTSPGGAWFAATGR
jgi:hypothetical protein